MKLLMSCSLRTTRCQDRPPPSSPSTSPRMLAKIIFRRFRSSTGQTGSSLTGFDFLFVAPGCFILVILVILVFLLDLFFSLAVFSVSRRPDEVLRLDTSKKLFETKRSCYVTHRYAMIQRKRTQNFTTTSTLAQEQ